MTSNARLVPELDVSHLSDSLAFYIEACGFALAHERPEELFAYLHREGAELMLPEADGPGRRFGTAALERPFGRGVSLQVQVAEVRQLHARLREPVTSR